jgi:hypothetical protein
VVLVRARLRRALLRRSLFLSQERDKFIFFAPQILVCLFSDSRNAKFIRACTKKDFPTGRDLNHRYLLYLSAEKTFPGPMIMFLFICSNEDGKCGYIEGQWGLRGKVCNALHTAVQPVACLLEFQGIWSIYIMKFVISGYETLWGNIKNCFYAFPSA